MSEQNGHNPLDTRFRDAFADLEVTPSPEVWEEVEKVLDAGDRKRPGMWWLTGLALLLLIGGGVWLYWTETEKQEHLPARPQAGKQEQNEVVKPLEQVTPAATSQSQPQMGNGTVASAPGNKTGISLASAPKSSSVLTVGQAAPVALSQSVPVNNITPAAASESESAPVSVGKKEPASTSTTPSALVTTPPSVSTVKSTAVMSDETKQQHTDSVKKESINPILIPPGTTNKTDSAQVLATDSILNKKKNDTLAKILSTVPMVASIPSADSLNRIGWSLSGFTAPEVYVNKIKSYSGMFDVGSERRNPRFNSGVRIGICFRDKVEVSAGVSYSQISQEEYAQPISFPKTLSQPFLFNSSLGDMLVPSATMLASFNQQAPVPAFRCKYQYSETVQFLNIPLHARINFRKGRWGGYVSGGVALQYAFSQQATLELLKENETDRVNYNTLDVRKINYAVELGIGGEVRVTSKLAFFLEPNARMNLLPVTNHSAVQSAASYYGVAGGVRWNL